jgi:hypothetical protein
MNKKIFSREFSLCFSSILVLVLVIVLVPLLQFYLHEQNKIIGAYASPSNTTLYFDFGNSPDKLTIEALPVTPQAQYTMWLFETSIKLGNSTTAMTSGESNTLGNGEGLFNAVFTVPSKVKNMYLAALYSGNNTSTPPITEGAARCYSGTSTSADTQALEQQCRTFVDKNREINDMRLTENICKPMTQKNVG